VTAEEAKERDNEETIPVKGREEKLRKKKARMKQHGKGLGKIYRDAVEKKGRGS
jgi:hypothetical protein